MNEATFWTRVDQSGGSDACWPWTGGLTRGYGSVHYEGRMQRAHRVAYELLVGPIPAGLHIDHLCRHRACCNPAHMEPVTNRENVLRGVGLTAQRAQMTECDNGHLYTPENTRLVNGIRKCQICWRRKADRRNARCRAVDREQQARDERILQRGFAQGYRQGQIDAGLRAPSLEGARHPTLPPPDLALMDVLTERAHPHQPVRLEGARTPNPAEIGDTLGLEGARHPEAGETP